MENNKIIDVHSFFVCNGFFGKEAAVDKDNNEADFFKGYMDATNYFSIVNECHLPVQIVDMEHK